MNDGMVRDRIAAQLWLQAIKPYGTLPKLPLERVLQLRKMIADWERPQ